MAVHCPDNMFSPSSQTFSIPTGPVYGSYRGRPVTPNPGQRSRSAHRFAVSPVYSPGWHGPSSVARVGTSQIVHQASPVSSARQCSQPSRKRPPEKSPRAVLPSSGDRIRTCDLWVMSRPSFVFGGWGCLVCAGQRGLRFLGWRCVTGDFACFVEFGSQICSHRRPTSWGRFAYAERTARRRDAARGNRTMRLGATG